MNYFPFHIGDYASATQHLTLEEDGMYRRLLDLCYTTEKPLTKDQRQLFRLTRAASDAHREAMLTVLHEFFTETDEGWVSQRAMVEIEAMREKQQKQKDRANKRWHKPEPEPGNATAMPRHPETDAVASKPDAMALPPTPTPTPKKDIVVSPAAPPQGTRLDKDWTLPDDWRAWCTEHRPDLDPQSVADQFRDFWVAKPGKDGRKADWMATWRNWCRSQKPGLGMAAARIPDRMTENAL